MRDHGSIGSHKLFFIIFRRQIITVTVNALGKTGNKVQKLNVLDSTKMACFNNVNRTIIEDDAVHIYGGRPNSE